ncbi:SMP-30/gluconolactonase/LRE family protein [Frigoribacterium sp. CG_9.8]|uniref:SMP-30/gluconolactonase/LRE family protein n=1 Tax=Frigoribacterium sp. CG_9.8 TaxID=2787733 RepID=UPI0018CB0F4B|nr:sugar lactone lactonase YvrE [Frigoribacterium sp. CG_9.8]
MTVFDAVRASSERHVLAEGPVWVADSSQLIWIDVEEGTVFLGRIRGAQIEQTQRFDFDGRVGAAVPGTDGSLLVAAQDRLVVIAADGSRIDGPLIVADGVDSRSNDGAVDPAGRFLVGTLALDGREGQESLYRWERDGSLTTIDSDLTLSNGLVWSPDGTLMYSTDTVPGIIWVRDYDAVSGVCGARRQFVHIEHGYPDGICVDARGHLWVAIWGAGEVRSFDPYGVAGNTVTVPVPHVSSVAFVGDDLDWLLITTASRDLSPVELADYPGAGFLFLANVGVTGTPTTLWDCAALRGPSTQKPLNRK